MSYKNQKIRSSKTVIQWGTNLFIEIFCRKKMRKTIEKVTPNQSIEMVERNEDEPQNTEDELQNTEDEPQNTGPIHTVRVNQQIKGSLCM